MVSINSVVISGGAGFPGHSGVLGAVVNISLELNMVIGAAGDVNLNCWGYENSSGGMDDDISDVSRTNGSWCSFIS